MNIEEVFRIVKGLSHNERKSFSKYVGASKKSQYYLIFNRLLKQDELDEKKIRGTEFKDSSKYYHYKKIIVRKIIESLVFSEELGDSLISFVEKSIQLDALDFADERFRKEFEKAIEKDDDDYILFLHRFRTRIAEQYDFQLQILNDWPSIEEVQQRIRVRESLIELNKFRKSIIRAPEKTRKFQAPILRSKLGRQAVWKDRFTYLFAIAERGIFLLERKFHKAYEVQKGLIESMDSIKITTVQQIKELSLGTRMAIERDDRESAMRFWFQLSALTTQNRREDILKRTIKVRDAILLSGELINRDMAMEAFKELHHYSDLILSDEEKALLLYNLGLIAFSVSDFDFFKQVQVAFHRINRSARKRVSIFMLFIQWLVNEEKGNIDEAEEIESKIKIDLKKRESVYLNTGYRIIREFSNIPILERRQFLLSSLDRLLILKAEDSNNEEWLFLDLTDWITAKLERVSIATVSKRKTNGFNSIRLVAEA